MSLAPAVANGLTLARLLAAPVVVWLLVSGRPEAAFWLFLVAGATDAADGAVARAGGARSALGAALDPLADKALLAAAFLTLGWLGALPSWLVIGVITRDGLIVGGVLLAFLLGRPMALAPHIVSKANTLAQIVLVALVLARLGPGFAMPPAEIAGIAVVAALTVLSAALYLRAWLRHMAGLGSDFGGVA